MKFSPPRTVPFKISYCGVRYLFLLEGLNEVRAAKNCWSDLMSIPGGAILCGSVSHNINTCDTGEIKFFLSSPKLVGKNYKNCNK